MANEIKNRQHAIGIFAPVPAAPFTTPIVSSVGFSSFVRNGPGNYTVGLQEPAQFSTHAPTVGMGANVLGTIGAQVAPDGLSVLVTAFDALGVPFDPSHFELSLGTTRDGVGEGPAPALPAAPTPPAFGAGGLIGWCAVSSAGGILLQSASAPVLSVSHPPGIPVYAYTMKAGIVVLAAHAGINGAAVAAGAVVDSPSQVTINTTAEIDHTTWFYGA